MPQDQTPEPNAETVSPTGDPRSRIIDALMELAAERNFEEITLSDICHRASVSLSQFRDLFPSKGAVLGALSRKFDKAVLDGTGDDLVGEPAKERLFDVLMRRLDAMAPYKAGLEGVARWARREPLAAAPLNRMSLNSMRFMLEAAGLESEGGLGALKLQGLVLAWLRVLDVWFRDEDADLSRTMAALDRELERGSKVVARLNDLDRLSAPFQSLARAVFNMPRNFGAGSRARDRRQDADADHETT
jgi:AcrR family transcriptional regulator